LRITRSGAEDGDRGRSGDRLAAAHARRRRQHGRDRIAGEAHDEKADDCVPEPDHRPRQGEAEQQQQNAVRDAEPAGRQGMGGKQEERGDC
jgi:hypothetical protein